MSFPRLAAFAVAMLASSAAAQTPQSTVQRSPLYEDAFRVVADAGCERKETDTFIRFFCEPGQAFWYFTKADGPAHPGYQVRAAYMEVLDSSASTDRRQLSGLGRFDGAGGPDAFRAWMREISKDWSKSVSSVRVTPRFKRDPRGKLYPLEPLAD